MKNNKVAIYARLSREDEDKIDGNKESRSIENQIKVLSDYATQNEFDIFEVYYDDGISGATQERPGFHKMMEDAKKKKFNILLVKDISRLGRTMHHVGKLIDETFPSLGLRVISIGDKYDSSTYKDDESIVIRNFLNAYYLKDFKRKIHRSVKHRSQTKHMKTYVKYGFLDDGKGGTIIDPYASEIIKRIFRDYVAGKKPRMIVRELNREKILPRAIYMDRVICKKNKYVRASEKWNNGMIVNIIKDYEYCGHIINLQNSQFYEPVYLKNMLPQIIDEETFEKAQKIRLSRGVRYNDIPHIADLLYDPESGKHPCYSIREFKEPKYCFRVSGYSINVSLVHKILYQDALEVIKLCLENKEKFYEYYKNKLFKDKGISKEELTNKINKLNKEYESLVESFVSSKVSEQYFKKTSDELNNEIARCEELLKDSSVQEIKFKKFQEKFNQFLEDIKIVENEEFCIILIRKVIGKVILHDYTKKCIFNKKYKLEVKYKFELIS
ncbi:MAG: recombinase family protein [Bacilli bacterium]